MNRGLITLCLLIIGLLTGCAASHSVLAEKSAIAVELLPSAPAKVSSYSLRQENGKLVIAGRVTSLSPIRIPGHVDLVVCGPDGQATGPYQAPIYGYASKRGGLKSASFSADISPVPIDGSAIRLKYDAPPTVEEHLLACQMEKTASR